MRKRGMAKDDGAQLMMLAGVVLTISFILTALTLAQVSALEREAATTAPTSIVGEWRFLHERLASNLDVAVTAETTNDTFNETILPAIAATLRSLEAEKGYDLVLRKAGGPNFTAYGNEEQLVVSGSYAAWAEDGSVQFTHPADNDLKDGTIWQVPCPDADAPASGCIVGVYLFVRLSDGTAILEESILFGVNQA